MVLQDLLPLLRHLARFLDGSTMIKLPKIMFILKENSRIKIIRILIEPDFLNDLYYLLVRLWGHSDFMSVRILTCAIYPLIRFRVLNLNIKHPT